MNYNIDQNGYYGDFGGAYIPEMLYTNIFELKQKYLLNSNILIPLKEWDIQLDRLLPNESPEVIQERVFH